MLIIKNGRVIDPLNKVDEVLDVAVEGRKILKVEKNIPTEETDNVIDAQGCYVVPGLIDHHAHLKPLSRIGIPSEAQCFAAGVTTAVDAGSCGPANFPYHYGILKRLRLGIKAYLNVATTGLDTLPGNVEDVNPEHWDRQAIKEGFYPDFIATDGTRLSMNLRPTTFNEAMQLAKYTALGIPFDKVLECATVNPARDLGILDQAGSLTAGHPADIAVLRPVKKDTVHGDRPNGNPDQHTMVSHMLYQPVFTVKNGEMVFRDLTF